MSHAFIGLAISSLASLDRGLPSAALRWAAAAGTLLFALPPVIWVSGQLIRQTLFFLADPGGSRVKVFTLEYKEDCGVRDKTLEYKEDCGVSDKTFEYTADWGVRDLTLE